MQFKHRSHWSSNVHTLVTFLIIAALAGCSTPQPRLTGIAYEYDSAKDMLKKGRFEKALEFSEAPAKSTPPNEFTSRAQVFQVVVYSGLIRGYGELADSYRKGSETTKNSQFKAAFERQSG